MTAPTHVVFGISCTLTVMHLSGAQPTAVGWLAVIFGSLAPDLDSRRSTIAKPGFIFERLLPRILVDLLNSFGQAASWLFQKGFGHRGALHWPVTGFAILLLAVLAAQSWLIWFAIAYLSHVLADFCTKGGIPILAPFSERRFSWSPIRTGSLLEGSVCLLLCVFIAFAGFRFLPEKQQTVIQLLLEEYLAEPYKE